jgi:hypothetical protein
MPRPVKRLDGRGIPYAFLSATQSPDTTFVRHCREHLALHVVRSDDNPLACYHHTATCAGDDDGTAYLRRAQMARAG